jgi:NAD(P)H-hydrate epimerase
MRTASKEARKLGTVLLLKVANGVAVISDGKTTKINLTGNAGMAKGGVGDILSGIAATFLSWNRSPFQAAAAAAFICGRAGDLAFHKSGNSLTPTDILECIGEAMRAFDNSGGQK